MKININNLVIAKTPRNKPVLVFCVFFALSFLSVLSVYYLTLPNLFLFDGINTSIRFYSFGIKLIGGLFICYITIALAIAAIRNNTKSQPVEFLIFCFGIIWFIFFFFFSTPLTYFWADIHGYHLDHYESSHRGGWYIFKLNDH